MLALLLLSLATSADSHVCGALLPVLIVLIFVFLVIFVKLILEVVVVHLVCRCLASKVEDRVRNDAVLEVLADLVVELETLVKPSVV